MAKKKTNSTQKKQPPSQKQKAKSQQGLAKLDAGARAYARLMADPCLAPTVPPVYNSSGTGNIVRLEWDYLSGAEATGTGAAIIFTPGLLSDTGGPSGTMAPLSVVTGDLTTITWNDWLAGQTGASFRTQMGACRALAACVQVTYVGSEQSRSGLVSLMQTTRGNAKSFTTLGALRTSSERVVKLPDGTLEIKLVPNARNADFIACDGSAKADSAEMPALVVGVSGIPNSTGVRIRCVQVLEFMPIAATSIMSSTVTANSTSTLQGILAEMSRRNPGWQYELLTGLGAYAARSLTWL